MKNSAENDLLALGGLMRQGQSYLINNVGRIIAVITMLVATLVTFTNVAFADVTGESFTVTLTVMLLSSYLMYFSLEDAGEREGEKSEEYKNAYLGFLEVRRRISPDSIDALRAFCLDYTEKELTYRRLNYLCEHGLSKRDLDDYRLGKPYPGRMRRHLITADKMRAVILTPAMLLSRAHGADGAELVPPERKKLLASLVTLIPSTLCTVLTVTVILSTKNGLTPSGVLDGIMKLSALPVIGCKGFIDGHRYATEAKVTWFETKTRLLEAFLANDK
jgi:hypothetical protein